MHSEILANQDRACGCILISFGRGELLRHARAHREVIRRFGRFPYRNAALGRESTPEEVAFLAGGRLRGGARGDRGLTPAGAATTAAAATAGQREKRRWQPRPTTSP